MTDQTHTVWYRQFKHLADVLAPYVVAIDGDTYIGQDAPQDVADMYSEYLTVGYARGWIE